MMVNSQAYNYKEEISLVKSTDGQKRQKHNHMAEAGVRGVKASIYRDHSQKVTS